MYTYIAHTHTHTHTHIYIYTYIKKTKILPISREEPKCFGSHNVKTNVEVMRSLSSTRSERKGRSWQNNLTFRSVYSRTQTLKRNIRTTVTSQPQACKVFLLFENRFGGFKSHSGCGSTCVHKLYLFFPLWVLMTFWFSNHWVHQKITNKSEKPKGVLYLFIGL